MDLDEIIKGLEICEADETCDKCPYKERTCCTSALKEDALAAIKELRAKAETQKEGYALKGMLDEATEKKIAELRSDCDAQVQVIETLQAINARLEGKVEAYEYALRLAIE